MPPLTVGWTPLYRADRLAAGLGLKHVWVKDEGREPSASFKDRASVVAVVKAQERGAEVITTSSTGNAGAALSAMCASVGQKNVIFVPESAPPAKITQLLVYGSTVILVRGTYDDAFELCAEAAKEFGWYNRNTGYNPYMTEGKKTAAYEICEQFTAQVGAGLVGGEQVGHGASQNPPLRWDAPDRIFVSVGDGCVIGGIHKGLKDLMALGWITKMPKIMGVQAAGSAALYDAWRTGISAMEMKPIDAQTIADSISAGLPADRIKGLAAVRETGRRLHQSHRRRNPGRHPAAGPRQRRLRRAGRRRRLRRPGQGRRGWPGPSRRTHRRPLHRQRPERHRLRPQERGRGGGGG